MKFLLVHLFALLLSSTSFAQRVVDGDIFPGIGHSKNYILNGEIEKNDNNITDASGIASRSTATPLSGSASLLVDGTANAQKVIFTASAREPSVYGQTCQASFVYNGDASLYTASIEQGGSTLAGTSTTLTNAGTSAATAVIDFACGVAATGANTLVLTCTSASCAAIRVDKAFMGLPPRTSTAGDQCSVRAVSSTDTATVSDCLIHASGTYTETLYTPSNGNTICVKNTGTGTVTLAGGGNIEDETSQTLGPGTSLCLYGYSSNWYIK
jgi:hypothetical protein